MAYELLNREAVLDALERLDGWDLADDGRSISRSFVFDSFPDAFGFMAQCALAAERLDHHPDWTNSYSRVDVTLTTHVKKQLTDRDFALAAEMDRAYRRRL
jgi:4a-hydroxytetrahydrobiopterin dehydratase